PRIPPAVIDAAGPGRPSADRQPDPQCGCELLFPPAAFGAGAPVPRPVRSLSFFQWKGTTDLVEPAPSSGRPHSLLSPGQRWSRPVLPGYFNRAVRAGNAIYRPALQGGESGRAPGPARRGLAGTSRGDYVR